MTEPEVAGSDPTQIRTSAEKRGDNWVINGHKWFTSGANGAAFAIVIAKTDPDADPPQARNSAFLVSCDNPGWQIVRDIRTMAGHGNPCEGPPTDAACGADAMFGVGGVGPQPGPVC